MNWPQIGSQVVSTLIAGIIAAGPLGLAAKFYLDRSLKRLDASAAERLEKMKDELNQKRDSRLHASSTVTMQLRKPWRSSSRLFRTFMRV